MVLKHVGTLQIGGPSGPPRFVTEHAVERVWVFPKDRFVEYEPKDEPWCRALGIGHEETRPAFYLVDGRVWVHPSLVPALDRAMAAVDGLRREVRAMAFEADFGRGPWRVSRDCALRANGGNEFSLDVKVVREPGFFLGGV